MFAAAQRRGSQVAAGQSPHGSRGRRIRSSRALVQGRQADRSSALVPRGTVPPLTGRETITSGSCGSARGLATRAPARCCRRCAAEDATPRRRLSSRCGSGSEPAADRGAPSGCGAEQHGSAGTSAASACSFHPCRPPACEKRRRRVALGCGRSSHLSRTPVGSPTACSVKIASCSQNSQRGGCARLTAVAGCQTSSGSAVLHLQPATFPVEFAQTACRQ